MWVCLSFRSLNALILTHALFIDRTYIRANIVQQARMVLARSATVAIRYCSVRRQFADRDAPFTDDGRKPSETQVINYQLVQARIFPPLVQAFACHYSKFTIDQCFVESTTK